MTALVIGLTGGIGSGKTTVANMFGALGVDLIDADLVARQVVTKGAPALDAIAQHFGAEFINESGELDRAKLRAKIFSEPQAKQWLNQLLHPLIRTEIIRQISEVSSPYCLLIAPLLIENNLHQQVARVLVVDVDEHTQQQRTMARDKVAREQVQAIIAAQLPRKQRLSYADDIIDNSNQDLTLVSSQVNKLHQKYLKLAQKSAN